MSSRIEDDIESLSMDVRRLSVKIGQRKRAGHDATDLIGQHKHLSAQLKDLKQQLKDGTRPAVPSPEDESLHVSWCCTETELVGLRGQWTDLLESVPTAGLTATWEWSWAWCQTLRRQQQLRILCLRSDEELVGVVPLMLERGGVLNLLGADAELPPAGLLLAAEGSPEAAAILGAVWERAEVTRVRWDGVDLERDILGELLAAACEAGLTFATYPLRYWSEVEVADSAVRDAPQVPGTECRTLDSQAATASLPKPEWGFVAALAAQLGERGQLYGMELTRDRRTLAKSVGMVFRQVYYVLSDQWLFAGRAAELAQPLTLCHLQTAARAGAKTIAFWAASNVAFPEGLSSSRHALCGVSFPGRKLRSRLQAAYEFLTRPKK